MQNYLDSVRLTDDFTVQNTPNCVVYVDGISNAGGVREILA